jgi:nucleoside-diphosphate-sugar epimerase
LSFSGKKILVTGAAGFIGSNLVLRLLNDGAQVTAIDSLIPTSGGNPYNLGSARGAYEFLPTDQRDEEAMLGLVRGKDFIFNLTGSVSHQTSMLNPRLDQELNVLSHVSLLEACRRERSQAVIVHTSTRQLYGNPDYLPVDEKHPTRPIDVNGINKLAGEHYHHVYHRAYELKTTSLRLTNTYGPRQSIKDHHQGVIGWFVNRAITNNMIKLYGGGGGLRDFNYVTDVVDALLAAAIEPRCYGQFFNLSGERASLKQLAESLVRIAGSGKCESVPFPPEQKKIDIGDYYGTSDAFRALTGWVPKVGLEEGLREYVKYYQTHLKHYYTELKP